MFVRLGVAPLLGWFLVVRPPKSLSFDDLEVVAADATAETNVLLRLEKGILISPVLLYLFVFKFAQVPAVGRM